MPIRNPDRIVEVEVWDGSSWMHLKIGIMEKIYKAIKWGTDKHGSKVGQIFDQRYLPEVAIQIKRVYEKKYKTKPYWFIESRDIFFRKVIWPSQKVEKKTEKSQVATGRCSHKKTNPNQLSFDLFPSSF